MKQNWCSRLQRVPRNLLPVPALRPDGKRDAGSGTDLVGLIMESKEEEEFVFLMVAYLSSVFSGMDVKESSLVIY